MFKPSASTKQCTENYASRAVVVTAVFLFSVFAFSSTASAQTYKISGHVTDGFGNSIAGATVDLTGAQTATTTTDASGNYSLSNLQGGGTFNLRATKPGNTISFVRTISNLSSDLTADLQILFFVNFQISVRDAAGVGVAAVGIRVNNEPFTFAQTNSFGSVNIGIGVPITGNGPPVTFTPDKAGYIFTPPMATLSTQQGGQVVNFTAAISHAPPIQLLLEESGPDSAQAAAIDSVLFTRDPFPVLRPENAMVSDGNTHVTIMATNLQLAQGETASAVIVILTNGNIMAEVFAEDVRALPGFNLTQVTFRLPNQTPAGTYAIHIKAHGQTSNSATFRITN